MRTLLMFCYILFSFLLVSCGDSEKKKQEVTTTSDAINTDEIEKASDSKIILFFGTSLTAGMGLDIKDAFPAIIQRKLDSLNASYTVINAGLSGETTASGKNRLDWVLQQNVDIFVLELGANDGLRGIPLEETKNNLQAIIDMVRAKNPDAKIVLAGMQLPPNMGQDYTGEFKGIFPKLAEENDLALIPFLLEDVGGNPELNQPDGIHPTEEGHQIMAKHVWEVIQPLTEE